MLCRTLGYPHPDFLLPLLTWEQWRDWRAYYDADPWGEWRSDIRQFVLIRHLKRVPGAHEVSEMPKPIWPYYETMRNQDDPAELLTYMQTLDKALVPKAGGGYELAVPLDQLFPDST